MDRNLQKIKEHVYDKCSLELSDFFEQNENKEYAACRFKLNGFIVISRSAKVTPKKVGQFVTFWKRNQNGIIEPFNETDDITYFVISVNNESNFGQFIFPQHVLIKRGIISTLKKEGKRGFRVYPPWDEAKNNQAIRAQKWQLDYFITINESVDLERAKWLLNEV